MDVPPDPRMANIIGGIDEAGQPIPMSADRLRDVADRWPTTSATPEGVRELLRVSRELFVHSYHVYEFLTVAAAWSLLAVEGGLGARLPGKATFEKLIDRASSEGILLPDMAGRLHAGRKLRNRFSHPTDQMVITYGMAAPLMDASHQAVATLFP